MTLMEKELLRAAFANAKIMKELVDKFDGAIEHAQNALGIPTHKEDYSFDADLFATLDRVDQLSPDCANLRIGNAVFDTVEKMIKERCSDKTANEIELMIDPIFDNIFNKYICYRDVEGLINYLETEVKI